MNIHLPDREVFGFAGLWEEWKSPDGPLRTFTIITTSPNALMEDIHNRMPVILQPTVEDDWLNPANQDLDYLQTMLLPYAGDLEAIEVSKRFGNVAYDAPDCIEAITDSA